MNTTSRGNPNDKAAELFGASAERDEFERSARDRADEPQTAPVLTLSTFTIPIIVTVTVCSAC